MKTTQSPEEDVALSPLQAVGLPLTFLPTENTENQVSAKALFGVR